MRVSKGKLYMAERKERASARYRAVSDLGPYT